MPETSPSDPGRPTIVTLTMNPALDISTTTDRVHHTSKVRCHGVRHDPGGGGINVARIAHVLGAPVTAVFPIGGHTGELLTDMLEHSGVSYHSVPIADLTRESLTVNEESTGHQYRFVLPGPFVTHEEQDAVLQRLREVAASAQFLVASGSLPPGVPADFYQRVADLCRELGVLLILDSSGGGLTQVRYGAFLVKPSKRELREYVGRDVPTTADQIAAAHELIDRGVTQAVVVSLGADGALLATADVDQKFEAIDVPVVLSGVGAGDAMVAGITVALSRRWSLSDAVRYGVATGSAMLLTPGTAPCRPEDVERLFAQAAPPVDVTRSPARN